VQGIAGRQKLLTIKKIKLPDLLATTIAGKYKMDTVVENGYTIACIM